MNYGSVSYLWIYFLVGFFWGGFAGAPMQPVFIFSSTWQILRCVCNSKLLHPGALKLNNFFQDMKLKLANKQDKYVIDWFWFLIFLVDGLSICLYKNKNCCLSRCSPVLCKLQICSICTLQMFHINTCEVIRLWVSELSFSSEWGGSGDGDIIEQDERQTQIQNMIFLFPFSLFF